MELNVGHLFIELATLGVIAIVILADLFIAKGRRNVVGWVAAVGMTAVMVASFIVKPDSSTALNGLFVLDEFSLFFKRIFAITSVIVVVMSIDYVRRKSDARGEFFAVTLFAALGMMLVASAGDFMSLFVSLELITISFYILVSYKRDDALSVEAGLKYVVLGALSSAFLLFGIALIYGATGTVEFASIKQALASNADLAKRADLLLGLVLVITGLGFKIAAVPFHVWAPDVYMGAPSPVTAFLSVGSKAAGFLLLMRVVVTMMGAFASHIAILLAVMAAVTVCFGNLAAIPQRNIKRMLGYSTIGHAGYLLMGLSVMTELGTSAVLFYIFGYLFTNLAAFIAIIVFARNSNSHTIEAYSGLSKRSPLLAACFTVALLSLAGVPPLAGFFGKSLVIMSVLAADDPRLWLAIVGAVNVVISMYYYLCVIKAMYVAEPRRTDKIEVPPALKYTLLACVAAILIIGIFQGPFLEITERVAKAFLASSN